jgi:hypothetical protein
LLYTLLGAGILKTKTMSVSIMEALQNADYNLRNNGGLGAMLAKEQLHNATVLPTKVITFGQKLNLYSKNMERLKMFLNSMTTKKWTKMIKGSSGQVFLMLAPNEWVYISVAV